MSKEELIGSVYGEWTILSYNEEVSKEKHRTYYNCRCSCGTIKPVCYNNLRNNKSNNCGCKKKERGDNYGLKDEIGNKYGRLTVFERSNNVRYGDKRAYWNCRCDCGNMVYGVCGSYLRNGSIQSCGCLQKEMSSKNMTEINLQNWKDEEYRDKQTKRMSEQSKQLWQNEEYRQMQTDRLREMWQDEEYRNSMSNMSKEMWKDEEYRQIMGDRLREQMKKRWEDEEYRTKMSGINAPNYKPNLTDEERELMKERRQGAEYKQWAYKIKERDNFICDCCGKKGGILRSHHLNAWKDYKEQRYDLDNGVCLCESCHKEFHKLYGKGDNTKEQYIEFKENKRAKLGVEKE